MNFLDDKDITLTTGIIIAIVGTLRIIINKVKKIKYFLIKTDKGSIEIKENEKQQKGDKKNE